VQLQWATDGNFIGHGTEQDPFIGNNEGEGVFTISKRPVRRRLQGLPRFVAVRGGEYCFMPSNQIGVRDPDDSHYRIPR
jgi:hypothetical protein